MERGFSLIQVIIASSMMSVVSLGVSTMISQQAKQVSYLEDRMSHQNLKRQIEDVLFDSSACQRTIENVQLPTGLVTTGNGTDIVIKNKNDEILFNTTDKSTFEGLRVKSIKLKNININNTVTDGKALIDVEVERVRPGSSYGNAQQMKPIQIEKNVVVDNSLTVLSCFNDSDAAINCLKSYVPNGVYTTVSSADPRCNGRSLGGAFGSACRVVSNPHRIPSDAKMIKFYHPSFSYDRNNVGVNNSNRTDSDYVFVPATDIDIPLDGSAKTSDGTIIRPGGTITVSTSRYSATTYYYNGREIISSTGSYGGRGQFVNTGYQSKLRGIANISVCDDEGLISQNDLTYFK